MLRSACLHVCLSVCLFVCPLVKVTIRPGAVPILNDLSRKNHSSPGPPICPVFGLASRICPDLPISAAICLRIGDQKLAQILSVYTKKSLADPAEELTTLPRPQGGLPTALAPVALAPYDSRLRRLSHTAVPELCHPWFDPPLTKM